MPLPGFPGEKKVTPGLDDLTEQLVEYKKSGACFAKWRAVLTIGDGIPSPQGIAANARALARYAAICQEQGLVPIVEPEVLMDGDHTIEICARVTDEGLHAVFHALHRQRTVLELRLLKPNMVLPGAACPRQATPKEVAGATLACLRRTVPAAVSGSIFSPAGGKTATANLNAMNTRPIKAPWQLSFSYAWALRAPTLKAWRGAAVNTTAGQPALFKRLRLNGAARQGKYTVAMEQD